MKRFLNRSLRILNILALLAMPIVVNVTTELYWTVADATQSFNSPMLCSFFVFPCINAAALIVLLRQKLGTAIYTPSIKNESCDSRILNICWLLKLILWSASAVFMAYGMLANTKTWDLNWGVCYQSRMIFTWALIVHLAEQLYIAWPVIKSEMTSAHHPVIRVLFTGKSLLFAGIAARKTMVEKIVYTVRTLHWTIVIFDTICAIPSVALTQLTGISLYERLCSLGGGIARQYEWILVLRLIELLFYDKD